MHNWQQNSALDKHHGIQYLCVARRFLSMAVTRFLRQERWMVIFFCWGWYKIPLWVLPLLKSDIGTCCRVWNYRGWGRKWKAKRLDYLQFHFLKCFWESLTFSLIHKLNRFLNLQNISFSECMWPVILCCGH